MRIPISWKGTESQFRELPLPERALWWARQELMRGVREVGTSNSGPDVEKYLKVVGLGPGHPWCAAFVSWCLRQAGLLELPKGAAAVRNWQAWRGVAPVKLPRRGDLMFWLNPDLTGHIGFVAGVGPGWVRTIEGNTNAAGSREGTHVQEKRRYWGPGSKVRFLRVVRL
jgi:hypothetical protein